VNRADFSRIAHSGLAVMNPISTVKLDRLIEQFDLRPGARVLDLGCGKGELLFRIGGRYPIEGVGVDLAPALLDEGRRARGDRAPGSTIELVAGDALAWSGQPESFDLTATVGASVGGYAATLQRLRDVTRPGGLVLLGEGYWRRPPSPEYLDALSATADELTDYAGTIEAGSACGLTPLYVATSSVDDFDHYEWAWSANGERYAAAHAGEPGVDELLAWIRRGRHRYVALGGRETLGFGLFLFRR
jgi:SAM-dependent methyltransferase